MPIVKCEASKATPLKGVDYILDPEKTLAQGIQNLRSQDPEKISKQMMQTMLIHGKGKSPNERKYYHCKLSFDPADLKKNGGTLDEYKANQYAAKFAKKTWPGREVVWSVQQHGTAMHIHFIVAACEQSTGKKLDARDAEYRKWKNGANDLAKEMGLSTLDWEKATAEKRAGEIQQELPVTQTFAEKGLQSRGKAVWKDDLRAAIDDAVANSTDMDEFKEQLSKKGVTLTRCTEQTISYKYGDHKACRGDKLGGDYTMAAIQDALQHNYEARIQPEVSNRSLELKIYAADVQREGGRVISEEEREFWREFGRLGGVTRQEIDFACDLASSKFNDKANKKYYWERYKKSNRLHWDAYKDEKNRINEQLSDRYAALKKVREIEWLLDPRNYRKTFLDMIFAMIMLSLYRKDIERIEREVGELKAAREILNSKCVEYRQAAADVRETLMSDNQPIDVYEATLKRMEKIADDMYEQNFQHQMQDLQKLIESGDIDF